MSQINLRINYQKVPIVEKNMFITRPIRYSTIGIEEISDYVASDSTLPRAYVAAVAEGIFKQIEEMLLNGHSIKLPNLGTLRFSLSAKASETLEEAGGAAVYRRRIIFTPSVHLKSAIRQTSLTVVQVSTVLNEPEESDSATGTTTDTDGQNSSTPSTASTRRRTTTTSSSTSSTKK